MTEDSYRIAKFLKGIFLFEGLSDQQLEKLTSDLKELWLIPGERLYTEGQTADCFYIIADGKLQVTTGRGREKRTLGTLIPADYIGEDLLLSPFRTDTVTARERSRVFCLEDKWFNRLIEQFSNIREIVEVTAKSRQLAKDKNYKRLAAEESVYIITRRHEFFLVVSLIFPILLILVSIPILVYGFSGIDLGISSNFARVGGFLLAIIGGFWFVWKSVDWGNDYYIVTSQRVLRLEKVVLLYDSQQDAPLNTILSKNITFNQVLKFFIDYGNVTVNTYTGSIIMQRTSRPGLFVTFIDGLQSRVAELTKKAEVQAREDLLRERMGMSVQERDEIEVEEEQVEQPPPESQKSFARIFKNFFKLRYEEGDTITYRKHWLVLIRKTWLPGLALIFVNVVMAYLWRESIFTGSLAMTIWMVLFIFTLLWWTYQYVDWRNDIYVVTLEDIIDIERKPLSSEEKRSAPLSNILSLEHTKKGILGLLLNVGDVVINIGTEKFTFDGVINPSEVQHEIFDRMYALRRRTEETEAARERERLADWFHTYHEQSEVYEEEEGESDWDLFPG